MVVGKERTAFYVRISRIHITTWNGIPLGYRVYYQSLLKLNSSVDPNDIQQIEATHDHKNFTNFTEIDIKNLVIDGLEDFTNYSIIATAYTSHGAGPGTQVFNRTMQGGRHDVIVMNLWES